MDPQWIIAGAAAATLLITWTSTIAGATVWLMRRLEAIKVEILADFKTKHEENSQKVEAMRELVMRHDIILDPEFNGSGKPAQRGRQ
jgi:hypothetical protein